MHIKRFQAENFKRLRVADICPRGNVVVVSGKNGCGKTSTLDGIAVTLGGAALMDPEPIHAGAGKASVKITLSDGVTELLVTRTFTKVGEETRSELRVEDATGRLSSPQKVLDALVGHMAFDPLEFTRKSPKAQFETLKTLVPLGIDLEALEAANKADYVERTIANKEAKAIRTNLEGQAEPPDGTPDQELGAADIRLKLQEASQHNGRIDAAKAEREAHITKIATMKGRIETGRKLLADLEGQLVDLEAQAFDNLPEPIVVQDLVDQLTTLSTINENVRLRRRLVDLETAATERESDAQALTDRMAERDRQKHEAIANAKMPVEGLGFGEGMVLFNGFPLQQASMAEQIRASIGIGMAANPKLRVMHIRDGSLLDEDSLTLVSDLAAANDFQVWMEKVTNGDKVGIVLEDGLVVADYQAGHDLTTHRVKAVPPPLIPPKAPRQPTPSVTPEPPKHDDEIPF